MKRRLMFIFLAIAVVLLALFLGIAYLEFRMASHTGDKAVAVMSPLEKEYFDKLQRVQVGMTYEDVVDILGAPDREALRLRPTWRVNGNPFSQVAAYFLEGRVRKVRWMKIGCFVYECSNPAPTKPLQPTSDTR